MNQKKIEKNKEECSKKLRLGELYDIEISSIEASENGTGGLTYFVSAGNRKYVVKYASDNEMDHPEVEIRVCEKLLADEIPACRFLVNKQGSMLSLDENGRSFTLQEYYEGETYAYHEAPVKLQRQAALLLARIHRSLREMDSIPTGIGQEFFTYRKPEYMKESYDKTLKQALEQTDMEIAERIRSNSRIVQSMEKYSFDVSRFSVGATHGDYMISQLIWKDEEIHGVIDWTSACKHPYIWEIVRSYIYMAPEVKQGTVDIEGLLSYIRAYLEVGTLNSYDIENAGRLFYYFLAVCDFYGQYYASLSPNRHIYLEQADMAAGLLVWFEQHIDELDRKLGELSLQMNYQKKMAGYYDEEGRLTQYPSKKPMRELALNKIAAGFEKNRIYTEKEVNEIIRQHIAFSDVELIRREMFQMKLLGRLRDGSQYWKE